MTDGPADERCDECGSLDPINCACPLEDGDGDCACVGLAHAAACPNWSLPL